MAWTDERVELLKKLWAEGLSASQIAGRLGGVTRNAVIGKVHRLGLSNRVGSDPAPAAKPKTEPAQKPVEAKAAAKPGAARAEPRPAAEAPAQTAAPTVQGSRRPIIPAGQPLPPQPSAGEISPEALASVREIEKKARRLTLMELTERTCKWPIGDPATEDFWFCGLATQQGKPYCDAHVGVAFQPMSSRRDRRR